ncbi:MAG: class I SAM-dependent methyltransferase [Thermodesulfobacteriota bacterium]
MEIKKGLDYSTLHKLDSPANQLIRKSIWGDQDIGQQSFITPWYLDELIRKTGIDADSCVLDIGSGVGEPAIYLAEKTQCRLMGIDISDVGVERARKFAKESRLSNRVTFYLGDTMEMPFLDNTFDVAISINVMNVFKDKKGLFQQVIRVLKPDGIFALLSGTIDMPDDPETIENMARGYLIPQYYDTVDGYKSKLKEAGFGILEVTEYVEDFIIQNKLWGDAYKKHYDAIVKEQGKENTDYHIIYSDTYLRLIDEGRAGNHLFISRKPGNSKDPR